MRVLRQRLSRNGRLLYDFKSDKGNGTCFDQRKCEHRFDLEENKGQFENELVETNEKQ